MKALNDRIVIDPKICHGKPVIRGTRTPVTVILNALAGGDTFETLQKEYDLTPEDITSLYRFCRRGNRANRLLSLVFTWTAPR
jgi:uncharacterized protein (DUF433 family)